MDGGSSTPTGPASPAPSQRPPWGAAMCYRLRPVLVTAVLGWMIFGSFRAGLLIARWGSVRDVPASDIAKCFLLGLRYDAMPIGYALAPMVLVVFLASQSAMERGWVRKAVAAYGVVLVVAATLLGVVGTAFLAHFHRRMNWIVVSYPKHIREVAWYIWTMYPILLIPPSAIIVAYVAYRGLMRAYWGPGGPPRAAAWSRLSQGAVLLSLCVLACRGGLDSRPLRFQPAYFSSNNLINELSMNDCFTLFYAVRSEVNNSSEAPDYYGLPSAPEAFRRAAEMLTLPTDVPLGSKSNPLWRRTDTHRPLERYNVVLIIMEGMSCRPVGALGFAPSYTPHLDALCREGMFFDRLYAVGERTNRAMMGVLCGHPDMTGVTILERREAEGRFFTLPEVFRQRGYRTLFIYGGDANFDNMQRFFRHGGIQEIIAQDQMPAQDLAGNWGVPDEVIFRKAHERFQAQDPDEPFFAAILTVSNHEPYQIPSGRIDPLVGDTEEIRRLNAYRYADWALDEYLRVARTADYFRRTIFVLVADHGHDLSPSPLLDVPGHRIPCLLYAPGVIPATRISVVGSQTDIAPTLLGLLGGRYAHCFLGRDLLSVRPGEGFAMMHGGGTLAFVRGERVIVFPPDQPKALLFQLGPFSMQSLPDTTLDDASRAEMQRDMLAFYAAARELYVKDAYRRPDDLPAEEPAHDLAAGEEPSLPSAQR